MMNNLTLKKQKLAFFLPSLAGGGAERVIVTLINSLAEQEFLIDLVLANATGKFFSLLDKRVKVIDLQSKYVFLSIPKLINYLTKEQPYILISAVENANTWGVIAKKLSRTRTKIIITEHSNWSQKLLNHPSLKEKILFIIARYVYPMADRIITVSDGIRSNLLITMHLDPSKVIRIYNPSVPKNLDVQSSLPTNHPWLTHKDKPVIISVGRLVKEKDYKTLIHAFSKVNQEIASRLIILGDGPERKNLQAVIHHHGLENSIDMPGFVDNPFSWMAKSDIFVMTSLYEGLPTVLIEALACGIPAISTDCISGPSEILECGKYGDLVTIGSIVELANALINNLNKSHDSTILKERANIFSTENATTEYLDLFQSLLN